MPPKPRYTREQVIKTALDIVRDNGIDALTAREVGARLGTSARPIFTAFENMDDLKLEVKKAAHIEIEEYIKNDNDCIPMFKKMGMSFIDYAVNEPQLFKLVYMQDTYERSFKKFISDDSMSKSGISLIKKEYKLSEEQADLLFDQMWVCTFGLSSMCAMKICKFTEKEISKILERAFLGTMELIKSGKVD